MSVNEMDITQPLRILVQQNCIAHYRRRLFAHLSCYPHSQITILADDKPDAPGIAPVPLDTPDVRCEMARNWKIRIWPNVVLFFQPGVLYRSLFGGPDAVIATGNPYSLTAWSLGILRLFGKFQLLFWTHGLLEEEEGLRWSIRKALYRLADGLLLYGNAAKSLLARKGIAESKLHVIYNSVDFEAQQRAAQAISEADTQSFRRRLGVERHEGLIIFSGRLQQSKRPDMIIEAIARLNDRGQKIHVVFLGDGAERAPLQTRAEELKILSQIHLLGEQYDENKVGLAFLASDLAVIPSGAGLSIMHALGYGVPVLIHNRSTENGPEWEAVKKDLTGFYFQYGDINDLAEKVAQAIFPVRLKPRLSQNCLAIIRDRYNPASQAEAMIAAVRASLNKRREEVFATRSS